LVDGIGVKGGASGCHYRIPGDPLDIGLLPLQNDDDVMNMLDLVPTHREIEVHVEAKRLKAKRARKSTDEVPEVPSNDGTIGPKQAKPSIDEVLEEPSTTNVSRVAGPEQVDQQSTFTDEDLFQFSAPEDNVGVEDDLIIDMVEELQSEPVVLELNNNFVDFEEVVEKDDVGTSTPLVNEEEDVVDVSDFEEYDVGSPSEPPVEMDGFKFDIDPHFDNLSKLVDQCMADDTDHDVGYNFDEFHSDEEANASRFFNLRKKRLKEIRREYEGRSNVKKGEFYVSEKFARPKEIKQKLRTYALESRRDIRMEKCDQERIRAICKGIVVGYGRNDTGSCQPSGSCSQSKGKFGSSKTYKNKAKPMCPWFLHVSKVGNESIWSVKTLKDEHKCLQTRKIKLLTARFLSSEVAKILLRDRKIPTAAIAMEINTNLQIDVPTTKISRARDFAMKRIAGVHEEQYANLRNYALKLKNKNKDTTVKIQVEANPDSSDAARVFRQIYVCLGALKKGYKAGRMDILGLDGAFIKGQNSGQVLTVVGVDSNNGLYPLAYAVVEAESKSSWLWTYGSLAILEMILICIPIQTTPLSQTDKRYKHGVDSINLFATQFNRHSYIMFCTIRQGILPAIAEMFPAAEHRICVRHIYDNMKQLFKGENIKELLWRCARASTVPEFNRGMEELKSTDSKAYD
jgi:hypothetical protein